MLSETEHLLEGLVKDMEVEGADQTIRTTRLGVLAVETVTSTTEALLDLYPDFLVMEEATVEGTMEMTLEVET
eukprot:4249593-Amphidinium_carterae.1